MNDKTKKALNIALKVGTWAIIAFTVFIMIFTLFSVTMFNKNERSIFGTRFYIVRTDSMSLSENNKDMDVHFNAGDIILVKEPKKDSDVFELEPGDIISFISANPDSWGETITHMIHSVERDKDGKLIGYRTFGTHTGAVDEKIVEPEFILGTYKGKLPMIGRLFAFMKTTPGYICCVLIPFLLIIMYHGANVVMLFKKYKSEQTAAINAEKEQIEKEREENQRMMAELMALKAKLEANGGAAPADAPVATEAKAEPEASVSNDEAVDSGAVSEPSVSDTSSEESASKEASDDNNSDVQI